MFLCSNFRSIVAISLFCCYVSSQRYTVRDTQCLNATKCYGLYEGEVTWDKAASYCQSIDQRLAVIPDQDTQDVISRFAGSGTAGGQLAWVGGRRSSSTMWRNVEGGTLGTQGIINVLRNGIRWCSGIRVTTLAARQELFAIPCLESNSFRPLCECPEVTECTTSPLYNVSSKCHEVSSSKFSSWESARAHCESLCQNGRLAFSVINQQHGALFVPNYGTDRFFWIGFHRRAWVWLAMQGEIVLSSFRNWLPGEGVGEQTECMMVNFSGNGGWKDIKCDVMHSKFICEFDPRTTTTTPSLTRSTRTSERKTQLTTHITLDQTTTDATTMLSTTTDRPDASTKYHTDNQTATLAVTSTKAEETSPFKSVPSSDQGPLLYYIIGGCAGVLLLITIVVIAVCCYRRKNKESQNSKHSVIEGERGTTDMSPITSTDLSPTKDGTATQAEHPNGTTESSAGLYNSVRHDKRKSGNNIGVNKDGQLDDVNLKPNETETSGHQNLTLENNDIYNDAEQVRARKAANKAKCINNKANDVLNEDQSVARDATERKDILHKDPVYDDTLEGNKRKMDAMDAEKHGSPQKARAVDPVYDDPAEVQVAKLRNPDEREAVGRISGDSDTVIIDNPLYASP